MLLTRSGGQMTREQRQRIVVRLNGRNQIDAFEAAKAIWRNSDPSLERSLISILRNGRRPFNRAAAAYAMQMVTTLRTIRALERVVEKRSEHPKVRGYAVESLAHGHRKETHGLLLKALGDPSKVVRFWCAFALGQMAELRAVPRLERLAATDKRLVRGSHSVAEEAADAIKNIKTENPFHRRRSGCVFCIRN